MMWLLWLLIGIVLPLLFYYMGLVVEVHGDQLLIRYVPLLQRSIDWDEITVVSVQTYQPIRQFGGWGIRSHGHHLAYSVKGDHAVELTLNDGHRILIGSQKPQDMALAIESQLAARK